MLLLRNLYNASTYRVDHYLTFKVSNWLCSLNRCGDCQRRGSRTQRLGIEREKMNFLRAHGHSEGVFLIEDTN
jgi:hypothetical protein